MLRRLFPLEAEKSRNSSLTTAVQHPQHQQMLFFCFGDVTPWKTGMIGMIGAIGVTRTGNRMVPSILSTCIAESISIESCHWLFGE